MALGTIGSGAASGRYAQRGGMFPPNPLPGITGAVTGGVKAVGGGLLDANQWVNDRIGTTDALAERDGPSQSTATLAAQVPRDLFGAPLRAAVGADRYAANFQGALNTYDNWNAPQRFETQAAIDRGHMDMAGVLANQGIQQNSLRANFDNARDKLGLQRQGLGIDRNAAGRAITNADVLEELANQMFGVNTKEAWETADQSRRAANSSATARGAMSAPGIGRTQQDITNQLANTNQKLDIGLQQDKVGFNEQRASAKDRQAQVDLLTKGLGLDEATLKNTLDANLSELGLRGLIDVNDIWDMIGSKRVEMNQLGIQILTEAFNAAGLGIDFGAMFPTLGAGTKPTVPGSGPGGLSPEQRGIR